MSEERWKAWDELVGEINYGQELIITPWADAILAADARIRELDAALCRAREAIESRHIFDHPFRSGCALCVAHDALSSTGPCRHEEEAKRLREAVEWALSKEPLEEYDAVGWGKEFDIMGYLAEFRRRAGR